MIKTVKGNVLHFLEGANALLHQTNTLGGVFGGLAGQIKNAFPEAYQADLDYYKKCGKNIPLGTFSKCWVNGDHKVIYNMYAQNEVGTHKQMTNYEAMENGFRAIKADLQKREWIKDPKLTFPSEIGCGLGGGDKKIVLDIIAAVFRNADFDVILVDYDG